MASTTIADAHDDGVHQAAEIAREQTQAEPQEDVAEEKGQHRDDQRGAGGERGRG